MRHAARNSSPDRRFRLCSCCGNKWQVSMIGASPRRYVCPYCDYEKRKKTRFAAKGGNIGANGSVRI